MKRMLVVTCAGLLLGAVSWIAAQEPGPEAAKTFRAGPSNVAVQGAIASGGVLVDPNGRPSFATAGQPAEYIRLSEEQSAELKQLRDVVEKLRDNASLSEDEANKLRSDAKSILAKQIDRDIQQRKSKLAEIERRATELKKQLTIREQNKEKTIEMLLLLAENPGTGLGIPNEWLQSLTQSGQTFSTYGFSFGSAPAMTFEPQGFEAQGARPFGSFNSTSSAGTTVPSTAPGQQAK